MSDESKKVEVGEAGLRLRKVLEAGVKLPQYQKGYLGRKPAETHCSVFARDVLDKRANIPWDPNNLNYGDIISEYDYDIRSINPGRSLVDVIVNTPIWDSSKNVLVASKATVMDAGERARNVLVLTKARGPVEVEPKEAFVLAAAGVVVWVVGFRAEGERHIYRHEAIVFPMCGEYNPVLGLEIAQAGGVNGIFHISNRMAFGRFWKDPEIRYFVFPEYEEDENV
jgi:hypothetical protein